VNESVLFDAVQSYLGNRRQGTASVKTRGEVSGGGKKPWRQKGTGRARSGSNASPLWVRGGCVFGPTPRDYGFEMPKKAKRLAFKSALSLKAKEDAVLVVEPPALTAPKTSEMARYLEKLGVAGKKCLFVTASPDEWLIKSLRNIPYVRTALSAQLSTYELLHCDRLLITPDALQKMKEVFSR
jgi:large subunit ribosomal protein L4